MSRQACAGPLPHAFQSPLPAAVPNAVGWPLATNPARALADYYLAARGGNAMLGRADFNPAALKSILPRVFLLELRSEQELYIRLGGTCLASRAGRDLTGLDWLDLIAPAQRAARGAAYLRMIDAQCGLRTVVRYPATLGDDIIAECLSLPLTPARADEPALAVGVVASLRRPAGAKPMPFRQGIEEITALPL